MSLPELRWERCWSQEDEEVLVGDADDEKRLGKLNKQDRDKAEKEEKAERAKKVWLRVKYIRREDMRHARWASI
jgi:hypothetical protein